MIRQGAACYRSSRIWATHRDVCIHAIVNKLSCWYNLMSGMSRKINTVETRIDVSSDSDLVYKYY